MSRVCDAATTRLGRHVWPISFQEQPLQRSVTHHFTHFVGVPKGHNSSDADVEPWEVRKQLLCQVQRAGETMDMNRVSGW
eukprot:CAMPEP_0172668872 /NCGR_PEP_ID=MMETSP1074-20121228/9330_1 /TAXON_ID=2916 /ORGANISM="Ceratium fusus, Strain PA161109" /LENGTH=79 /DNA_ID=CAMNT_0013485573 /DNA_START=69 /DNA_END=308 /DNA_ORIENTATION=+